MPSKFKPHLLLLSGLLAVMPLAGCGHGTVVNPGQNRTRTSQTASQDSSTTETSESMTPEQFDKLRTKVELLNILNDADCFIQANNMLYKNLKTIQQDAQVLDIQRPAESSQESFEAQDLLNYLNESSKNELTEDMQKASARQISDYVSRIYDLARTRLETDLPNVETASKKYLNYLAMLQAYVNCADSFAEYTLLDSIDQGVLDDNNEIWTYLREIEDFYRNLASSASSETAKSSS